jgi:hypothetical protein
LAIKANEDLEGACHSEDKPLAMNKQSGPPIVSVYRKTAYTQEDTVIPYDEVVFDSTNGGFDLAEGTFTVPEAGLYSVGFYARNFDNADTFVQVCGKGMIK